MALYEERRVENESLFREVNDNIARLEERYGGLEGDTLPIICECDDPSCTEQIAIGRDAYADVRAHPGRFVVVPGHQSEDIEVVVSVHPDYLVVEKVVLPDE